MPTGIIATMRGNFGWKKNCNLFTQIVIFTGNRPFQLFPTRPGFSWLPGPFRFQARLSMPLLARKLRT